MSITTSSETSETPTCGHCGTTVDAGHTVRGSYCSEACYYRDRGERVINQLVSDHQLCSTCYGRVKSVEPIRKQIRTPPPDYPGWHGGRQDVSDGLQYPTDRTTYGVDDFARERFQRHEDTRWSCECGAVNPGDTHADVQNVDLAETIANFLYSLEYLHERGAIPHAPDRSTYFDALREHHRDAAYAAGRAVYG